MEKKKNLWYDIYAGSGKRPVLISYDGGKKDEISYHW